jgi:hypothetical protein
MKPKLIHNWPKVKDQHDEISSIIKNVIYTHKRHMQNPDEDICSSPEYNLHKAQSDNTVNNKAIELENMH